ncbi:Cellulase [Thermosinus carboxydivorans Nor1]|uniref:Cellulase n=1 Tax=Thermosinus carboxydivorans Nor1 TaxID=401526 RepID=A1HNA6_9FIRM|nr:M42 family metallopeptidase [Thermosinus carboxydivorans]EAX48732.1 Cellulase [Thermosinus carboxydivorans Nor1]
MDKTLAWLKEISEAPGVSGFEQPIRTLLTQKLSSIAEVSSDNLGSVIFKKRGGSDTPKIMIAAHMDEIGFMVKYITKEGFLKFTTLGGWWEQVMLGQRVTVHTTKGAIPGVIGSKPPHILSPEERKKVVQKKDMYIDIGAEDEKEAKERFGVRPGNPVTPFSPFTTLANERLLMGKAWDNRIGCAIMAEVMEKLQHEMHANTVYGVGTVQEEVGLRGAKTSAGVIHPDIAFAVDTCVAGDTPGVTSDQASSKLGKGVAISIYDSSLIPHTGLRDFVVEVAEQNHIPYQLEFTEGGGTDAGRIHLHAQGVPSLVLSIPTRYIHSHNSIVHRDDYDAAVRLLVAVIKQLDQNKYQELVK